MKGAPLLISVFHVPCFAIMVRFTERSKYEASDCKTQNNINQGELFRLVRRMLTWRFDSEAQAKRTLLHGQHNVEHRDTRRRPRVFHSQNTIL